MEKCNYNQTICRFSVTMLLLVVCWEGHVLDKYLCDHHFGSYLAYLKAGKVNCTQCGTRLSGEYIATEYEKVK
jgi:hypothetical protein